MMAKQLKWFVMVILILSLAGLACQTLTGGENESSETADGADQALATVGPETASQAANGQAESSGDAQAAPFLDLSQLAGQVQSAELESYRMVLTMRVVPEGGGDPVATIEMQGAFQTEPAASTMAMTMVGLDELTGGTGTITVTQIDGSTYMVLGGSCITSQDGQDSSTFTDMANFENFLGSGRAQLVESNITINGIQADHYTFEQQDVSELDGVTEVQGDVYVATDGGYPVRVVFTATGDVGSLGVGDAQKGTIFYEMNFSDINQPVNIEVPAGCDVASAGEFPMLDDAFELTSFGDFLSYKTNKPFAEVVAFYKTEMAAAGWSLTNEFASEPVAQLSFSMDGRDVTISVVEDGTSDALLVNIIQ
jgi:hypothetical protein